MSLTYNINFATASDNLAILANFLYRALNFHLLLTDPGMEPIFVSWLLWFGTQPLTSDRKAVCFFLTSYDANALSNLLSGVFSRSRFSETSSQLLYEFSICISSSSFLFFSVIFVDSCFTLSIL